VIPMTWHYNTTSNAPVLCCHAAASPSAQLSAGLVPVQPLRGVSCKCASQCAMAAASEEATDDMAPLLQRHGEALPATPAQRGAESSPPTSQRGSLDSPASQRRDRSPRVDDDGNAAEKEEVRRVLRVFGSALRWNGSRLVAATSGPPVQLAPASVPPDPAAACSSACVPS